jgi:hypothetical protein
VLGALAISAFGQDIISSEVTSLTGSEATFDGNSRNGIELAKPEINNAGDFLGGRFGVAPSG